MTAWRYGPIAVSSKSTGRGGVCAGRSIRIRIRVPVRRLTSSVS